MPRETAVISIGIWVCILPFLGFPEAWRVAFFMLTGIGLVVLGFFMRAEIISRGGKKAGSRPFVDNAHQSGISDVRMSPYEYQEQQDQ